MVKRPARWLASNFMCWSGDGGRRTLSMPRRTPWAPGEDCLYPKIMEGNSASGPCDNLSKTACIGFSSGFEQPAVMTSKAAMTKKCFRCIVVFEANDKRSHAEPVTPNTPQDL